MINQLYSTHSATREELKELILCNDKKVLDYLKKLAVKVRESVYGKDIYLRGLIEFTNYCKNDCYYCGIRKSNKNAIRYRLTKEEILDCCKEGYELGFRTFVLQGGEDSYYSCEKICDIVRSIKSSYPDCAVTLSIGEKERSEYQAYFDAGADRYLLRHETADETHYKKLHPPKMSLAHRKQCLYHLKEIGYQVGCGFMVGSPYQTVDHLVSDLLFIKELEPEMVGIGPFISHKDTPFANCENGTEELTVKLLSIIRLLLPNCLLPATTALGTIDPFGREHGIEAGGNVLMPNLSPTAVRKKYMLYDNKICTGDESAQCRQCTELRMEKIGYQVVTDRGDFKRS
ncbi:Biotin synthase [Lachnospiraceae bacterium TWA4]|nr:Biotin synthase [Lachnospiraceae bacterium TWA4]